MSNSIIDQENRLTKIFHKGCIIDKSLIKHRVNNSGFFGNYVEGVLRQQGYKLSPNGVDLPELGIEVKTREYKKQAPLTLGRLNETEFKRYNSFKQTSLYSMCKKQFRIIWEYDSTHKVIRIKDSAIHNYNVYTIQDEFNAHFRRAQTILRENNFNRNIDYIGVGNGFCFERHGNTTTWQYRATEPAVKRLCKRAASDQILEEFVTLH